MFTIMKQEMNSSYSNSSYYLVEEASMQNKYRAQ